MTDNFDYTESYGENGDARIQVMVHSNDPFDRQDWELAIYVETENGECTSFHLDNKKAHELFSILLDAKLGKISGYQLVDGMTRAECVEKEIEKRRNR